MSDDLVKRLGDKWQHSEELCFEAADRIEAQAALIAEYEAALDALIYAKDEKDRNGKTLYYRGLARRAWERARNARAKAKATQP